MAALRRGRVLGHRYRIERAVGAGGMATVFAALDERTGARVALKVPHAGDPERIEREADVAARLTGPHVAHLLDRGRYADGDRAVPFLVFELLHGVDLGAWLAARGPVPAATAAAIVAQACRALAEAHAAGVVHRDLKPANLFLTTAGQVKVLDFGISCARGDDRLTSTGALLGSPAYMPPERMRPSTVTDHRSDLWSLGVVLYEAVSGRLPFQSEAFPDLCLKILLDDMPPLDAPSPFVEVVRRCLDKDPDARFGGAAELGDALLASAPSGAMLSPAAIRQLVPRRAPAVQRPRRSWAAWAAAAALALAPGPHDRDAPPEVIRDVVVTRPPSPRAVVAVTHAAPALPVAAPPVRAVARARNRPVRSPATPPAEVAPPSAPVAPAPAVADPLASAF